MMPICGCHGFGSIVRIPPLHALHLPPWLGCIFWKSLSSFLMTLHCAHCLHLAWRVSFYLHPALSNSGSCCLLHQEPIERRTILSLLKLLTSFQSERCHQAWILLIFLVASCLLTCALNSTLSQLWLLRNGDYWATDIIGPLVVWHLLAAPSLEICESFFQLNPLCPHPAQQVGKHSNFLTLALHLLSLYSSSRPFQSTRFRYSCMINWVVQWSRCALCTSIRTLCSLLNVADDLDCGGWLSFVNLRRFRTLLSLRSAYLSSWPLLLFTIDSILVRRLSVYGLVSTRKVFVCHVLVPQLHFVNHVSKWFAVPLCQRAC